MANKRKCQPPNAQSFKAYNPDEVIFRQLEGGTTKKLRISAPKFLHHIPATQCHPHSDDTSPGTEPSLSSEQSRSHYTASQLINDLMFHKTEILDAMLELECDSRLGSPCACGALTAEFRCEECFAPQMLCSTCCIAAHRHDPFHWILHWNGRFFQRITLASIELQIHLGHNGAPCPKASMADVRSVVVSHINGIQKSVVVFCACNSRRGQLSQLLLNKLFPATAQHPQSVFSFALLKQYQKHSSESGTPAYSYFAALKRLTNDVAKDDVEDRYREFLRVIRIWEHVQTEKYAGNTHNISSFLPSVYQDSLAVLCPSCPQPGINMAPNWQSTPKEKMHKHTLFLEVDGNFSLDERLKKKDKNDISLDSGRGFFVHKEPFDTFIREVSSDAVPEASTCSGFKAGDILRGQKKKNTVSSGVVGAACARHSLIRPHGMVDLQKGERYCNVDYALAHCLKDVITSAPELRVVLSYDVGCQYQVNLPKCMQKWFPEFLPLLDTLEVVVPKMHIKAHKSDCMYSYSFDFTPGVGQTDGEGGERIWSEVNQYSGSIREMSAGSRHDKLNRIISHWNWRKIQKMVDSLVDKCLLAQSMWQRYEEELIQLTESMDQTLIRQWNKLPTMSFDEKGTKVYNVYRYDPDLVPTQTDRRAQIAKEYGSHITIDGWTVSVGDVSTLLLDGFELVEYQAKLRAVLCESNQSSSDITRITRMRAMLKDQIKEWLQLAKTLIPSLSQDYNVALDEVADTHEIEVMSLTFPSSYPKSEHTLRNLTHAAGIEYKLREGQAHSALLKVRLSLTHKAGNVQARMEHVRGQKAATRAACIINRQADIVRSHAGTYTRARDALKSLGMSESNLELRELKDEDLTLKGMWSDPMKKSDAYARTKGPKRKPELSWIWRVGIPVELQHETAWSVEVQRVQWFLTRAQRDRWLEELEIVKEEMCRTIRFFHFFYRAWEKIAQDSAQLPGYRARAYKVMDLWTTLEHRARTRFGKDIGDLIDSERAQVS